MGHFTSRLTSASTVTRGRGVVVGPFEEMSDPVELQPYGNCERVLADRTLAVCVYRERFGDVWMWHVAVRRHDHKPIRDHWAVLQQVKDLVLGTDAEAVELYPAHARLIDVEHTYHLWSPTHSCPCGADRSCATCRGTGLAPARFEFGFRPERPIVDDRACVVARPRPAGGVA